MKKGLGVNNPVGKAGATPLYIAAQNGHLNVVEILLEKGADVFREIKAKIEELHQVAITSGREEEFITLKEKLSKENEISNFSSLDAALFFYHPKIAMALINEGAQINQEHTLLFWKWFCATPLYGSNQGSESYKQLKKSFENLIKQNQGSESYKQSKKSYENRIKQLRDSNQGSESYKQLKKSFENLIKQYEKNKPITLDNSSICDGGCLISTKNESESDTSRAMIQANSEFKAAEELTKNLETLDASKVIDTFETLGITEVEYCNGVISIQKRNIPDLSKLKAKFFHLPTTESRRSFPISEKVDCIEINTCKRRRD